MTATSPLPSSASGARLECFEPATRQPLDGVPIDDPEAVRATVARARAAQKRWGYTTHDERRRVLRAILDAVLEHSAEICEAVTRDSGKTRENALMGDVWPVCEKLRWTLRHAEKHLRPERVSSGLLVHKRARIEFHPLGVIGAIIPWNYPFQNVMNPLIPAIAAGNAFVAKPSEWVAWSASRLVPLVRKAIEGAGHDPDIVQIVNGRGETGQALVESGLDGIVFIGSVANGRRVLQSAAKTVTPVVLELGGKDPFIVCDDADIEQAAHAALAGCFINCGQNCVASERILIHRGAYSAFVHRVSDLVREFRQGDGQTGAVDMGAMTTPLQLEIVERLVQRATEEGARVVTGGRRVLADRGDFFPPTLIADVTSKMEIMQEETFGPLMLLCQVDSDAEAIEVANATAYGLGSSVFSKDRARARSIASRLEAGMTAINEYGGTTYMVQDLPFGGVKASGFGRINGREGLRAMCNVKAVLDDRFPFGFPTKVYPVGDGDFARTKTAIDLMYGSWRRRLSALGALVRPR